MDSIFTNTCVACINVTDFFVGIDIISFIDQLISDDKLDRVSEKWHNAIATVYNGNTIKVNDLNGECREFIPWSEMPRDIDSTVMYDSFLIELGNAYESIKRSRDTPRVDTPVAKRFCR